MRAESRGRRPEEHEGAEASDSRLSPGPSTRDVRDPRSSGGCFRPWFSTSQPCCRIASLLLPRVGPACGRSPVRSRPSHPGPGASGRAGRGEQCPARSPGPALTDRATLQKAARRRHLSFPAAGGVSWLTRRLEAQRAGASGQRTQPDPGSRRGEPSHLCSPRLVKIPALSHRSLGRPVPVRRQSPAGRLLFMDHTAQSPRRFIFGARMKSPVVLRPFEGAESCRHVLGLRGALSQEAGPGRPLRASLQAGQLSGAFEI